MIFSFAWGNDIFLCLGERYFSFTHLVVTFSAEDNEDATSEERQCQDKHKGDEEPQARVQVSETHIRLGIYKNF